MMQTNYTDKSGHDDKRHIFYEGRFVRYLLFMLVAALVLAGVVMLLWNAILPPLLHTNHINYRQALGLLVLCKILFGNIQPRSSHKPPFGRSPHWKQKWSGMNDAEKAKFKDEWKRRCEQRKG